MKKAYLAQVCIVVMAILAIGLAGCSSDAGDSVGTLANLSAITVAGIAPHGTGQNGVPMPIRGVDWDGSATVTADGESYVSEVIITNSVALENAAIVVTVSKGAKVTFGQAMGSAKPDSFTASKTLTLDSYGYLYVKVVSEDGKNVNYYRFYIVTASGSTTINSAKFGEVDVTLGTSAATYDAVTSPGTASLGRNQAADIEVIAVTAVPTTTVKYAKVTGSGAPVFGTANTFTFAHGDILYLEATAENATVRIYKINVIIGSNAAISDLTVGVDTVDEDVPVNLGTPAASLNDVVAGVLLLNITRPNTPLKVVATTIDDEATYRIGSGKDAAAPTWVTVDSILFDDGDYLYVEVTSQNTLVVNYYKVRVNFKSSVAIHIGQPQIAVGVIDPIWDTVEALPIAKIWRENSDADPLYYQRQDTWGEGKLLFDASGVYAYFKVEDPTIRAPEVVTDGFHRYDSIELFINEKGFDASGNPSPTGNINETQFGAGASQYRVGASGERSGHPAAATAAFNALNRTSAWVDPVDPGIYHVILQAPWRHFTLSDIVDGKQIGIELQINACEGGGVRDGVVVWNNVAHTNYQNISSYGLATLTFAGNVLPVDAQMPVITTQPRASDVVDQGGIIPTLTVVVTNPADGGTLSYQWYNGNGTAVTGAINASFTPDISAEGTHTFYVVVKNTNNAATGKKEVTTKSNNASIMILGGAVLPENWIEKIQTTVTSAPVYGFDIPSGSTLADYDRILVSIKMDAASPNTTGRLRAWGMFDLSTWINVTTNRPGMPNSAGVGLLTNPGLDSFSQAAEAGWVTYELELNARTACSMWDGTATGVVALAFGVIPPSGGSGNRVYFVKDIALSNSDQTKTVKALHPESPKLWLGNGAGAYVTQNGNDIPVRELSLQDF